MKLDKLIEETRTADEINRLFNWSEDELAAMDETEFRARFRERCHHTMEIQVYENAFRESLFQKSRYPLPKNICGYGTGGGFPMTATNTNLPRPCWGLQSS